MALRVAQLFGVAPSARPLILAQSPLDIPLRFSLSATSPTRATRRKMSTRLQVSQGHDYNEIEKGVEQLCAKGWKLEDGILLEKTFHFKTFNKATVRRLGKPQCGLEAKFLGSPPYDLCGKQDSVSSR
jgi:hypothetical protein